jgi:hypothetical protein
MRITIAPLSDSEVRMALEILNLPSNLRAEDVVKASLRLEESAQNYAITSARGARLQHSPWRYNFREQDAGDVSVKKVRAEWERASSDFKNAIDRKAGWCEFPWFALPSKRTIVLVRFPREVVNWFLVRLIANRQGRFFVRCGLCRRYAVRRRGSAKYCSARCQKMVNTEATYKKSGADFSEWLLKQPQDRALPPRMELRRMIALQPRSNRPNNS